MKTNEQRGLSLVVIAAAVFLSPDPAGGIQGRGHQLEKHRLHRQHGLHRPDQQEAHGAVPPAG